MSNLVQFGIGLSVGSFIKGASSIITHTTSISKSVDRLNQRKIKLLDTLNSKSSNYANASGELLKLDQAIIKLTKSQARLNSITAKKDHFRGKMFEALGLGYSLNRLVGSVIDYESSLTGLRKATNLSKADTNSLGLELMKLTRELPQSSAEINAIAEAGARLGIEASNLGGFTRLVSRSVSAFDIDANQAADNIAKLKNIYGLGLKELEAEVLDPIALLEDTGAVKAPEIIDFLTRVGSLSKTFGLTTRQASALGSTLIAQGIDAAKASSAVKDLLLTLGNAENGTAKFKSAISKLGYSASELKLAVGEDANSALVNFLGSINRLPKEDQLSVIAEAFGAEHSAKIIALASNIELYNGELAKTNDKTKTAGYLQQQYDISTENAAVKIKRLKNSFVEFKNVALSPLLDGFGSMTSGLASIINRVTDLAGRFPKITSGALGLLAAFFGISAMSSIAGYGFFFIAGGVMKLYTVFQAVNTIIKSFTLFTKLATAATWLFNIAMSANPVVLIVGAIIVAIVAIGVVIYKFRHQLLAFFKEIAKGFKTIFEPVLKGFNALKGFVSSFFGGKSGEASKSIQPSPGGVKGSLPSIDQKLRAKGIDLAVKSNKPQVNHNEFKGGINVNVNAKDGKLDKEQAATDIQAAVKSAMKDINQQQYDQAFALSG